MEVLVVSCLLGNSYARLCSVLAYKYDRFAFVLLYLVSRINIPLKTPKPSVLPDCCFDRCGV